MGIYTSMIWVVFFVLCFPSCSSAMPKEMPADLSLEFGRNGGMHPTEEELAIKNGILTYQTSFFNDSAGFTTSISMDEIQSLYQVLRDNKFDKIKLAEGRILDKEGEHVRAQWEREQVYLGTSGAEVADSWQKEWKKIVSTFDALIEAKAKPFRKTFTIILDKSLTGHYTVVTLSDSYHCTSQITDAGFSCTFQLLPGKYHAISYAIRDYNPKKYEEWAELQKRRSEGTLVFDTQSGSRLTVRLAGENKLVLELKEN